MTDGNMIAPVGQARLIVWCIDAQVGEPVLDALRRGYDLDLRATLPKEILTGADAEPEILLLCLSPVETLCRAMADGIVPSVALKEWQELAQGILSLNRRNRRKVRILDMDAIARHPGAFLGWFALPEDQIMITALSAIRQSAQDEVLHLLARRTLLGDISSTALMGELAAVSLSFAKGDDTLADDPDAAFLSYQASYTAGDQAKMATTDLAEDNITTRAPIKEPDAHAVQIEELRAELVERDNEAREQVSLLQAQNRYMQDETEAHLTRAAIRQAEKQQQVEALEQELQKFLGSRSYRLTAPLRKFRELLSGRRSL